MTKAVFFDYDGVLTTDKTGSLTTCRYLARAAGLDLAAVRAAFGRHNADLTLGRRTHRQAWGEICRSLGRELDIDLLREAFESTPLNAGMLALARKLKRRHVVGIITDNKKDRIDHLKRHQGLESIFSPIVVSAELGSDKGGPDIFLAALHRAGVRADEAVFIDNDEDNLVAPRALGMQACFHDDEANDIEALIGKLREAGVAIDDD